VFRCLWKERVVSTQSREANINQAGLTKFVETPETGIAVLAHIAREKRVCTALSSRVLRSPLPEDLQPRSVIRRAFVMVFFSAGQSPDLAPETEAG
jgi:hypothetical protein